MPGLTNTKEYFLFYNIERITLSQVRPHVKVSANTNLIQINEVIFLPATNAIAKFGGIVSVIMAILGFFSYLELQNDWHKTVIHSVFETNKVSKHKINLLKSRVSYKGIYTLNEYVLQLHLNLNETNDKILSTETQIKQQSNTLIQT